MEIQVPCNRCMGTGEGTHEGLLCYFCEGRGHVFVEDDITDKVIMDCPLCGWGMAEGETEACNQCGWRVDE
jgi:hypothetical protein